MCCLRTNPRMWFIFVQKMVTPHENQRTGADLSQKNDRKSGKKWELEIFIQWRSSWTPRRFLCAMRSSWNIHPCFWQSLEITLRLCCLLVKIVPNICRDRTIKYCRAYFREIYENHSESTLDGHNFGLRRNCAKFLISRTIYIFPRIHFFDFCFLVVRFWM